MKNLILAILVFNTFAIPVINKPEEVKQIEPIHEVAFWCDCGVSIHWMELPLMRV